jgi:hypothetical protein
VTTAVTSQGPFRQRTLIVLIVVGLASLAVALFLAAFADDFEDEESAGVNGYSHSAIGYRALVEVLRESGIPVMDSQWDSAGRARNGLLVVFAPELPDEESARKLEAMIARAPSVLLVLPRWWGPPDDEHPGWITERYEYDALEVQGVLDAAGIEGDVSYQDGAVSGDGPLPSVEPPAQTIDSADLDAELSAGDGILLGHVWIDTDTELWVLADPSPVDNAGLRRPGNAAFAIALVERLRDGGPVVFDETSHGFEDRPSLWKALTRFPLVLVSLHVMIGLVLIVWAAVGRWGPPRASGTPLPTGKDFLIRNTAELLHVGGHDAEALRRYLLTTIHQVKVALHAPLDLDHAGVRTFLERVRAERGGTISIVELEQHVTEVGWSKKNSATARRIVELAARIHKWRTEMTHGPQHHP